MGAEEAEAQFKIPDKLPRNPLAPDALIPVADADITDRKPNPVSMMPPALINSLNQDELLDLYAYILSGGNPEDPRFK